MKFKTIIVIIFASITAIVSLQNASSIELNFLFWSTKVPLILIILGSFASGVSLAFILPLLKSNKKE